MKTEKWQMRSFSATTEQKDRNRCSKQNNSNNTSLQKVKKFRKEIQEGPYYICVVCNRCLYTRSVILFKEQKYPAIEEDFFFYANVKCYNGCEYICHTCDTHLKKKKIPCQAVCNKLQLFEIAKRN